MTEKAFFNSFVYIHPGIISYISLNVSLSYDCICQALITKNGIYTYGDIKDINKFIEMISKNLEKIMKSLNTYIKEKLIINQRFDERLIINQNYKPYTCVPKSFNELRKIIEQRYKEQGPGTEKEPIDFNDIDISKINSFYNGTNNEIIGIFERTKFEYIDISNWNVSNFKYMDSMFFKCEKLKSPGDLSRWDVSNVENMNYMFYDCERLESVGDLSNWNVSSVENMCYMFYDCERLKSVGDLSNWDVSRVENIFLMFYNCKKLTSVGDLSNWNVSKVKDMNSMFYGSGITNIPSWYKE